MEKMEEELFSEESIEREFENSSVAWERFGQALSDAHRAVYERPTLDFPAPKGVVWLRYVGWTGTAIVLLLAFVGVGWFWNADRSPGAERFLNADAPPTGKKPLGAAGEDEADLDWDAGENELENFDSLLAQTQTDESDLDFEIAILDDSLGKLAGESSDEWF